MKPKSRLTKDQIALLRLQNEAARLPADDQIKCAELVDCIRKSISDAGEIVGLMAYEIVGQEIICLSNQLQRGSR